MGNIHIYTGRITLGDITHSVKTRHMKKERMKRYKDCLDLNRYEETGRMAGLAKVFVVNDPRGAQLHAVTRLGILFILSKPKFEAGLTSFITVYPIGLKRIYELYGAVNCKPLAETIEAIRRRDSEYFDDDNKGDIGDE